MPPVNNFELLFSYRKLVRIRQNVLVIDPFKKKIFRREKNSHKRNSKNFN